MQLRITLVLLAVVLFASNVGAQMAMGLMPARDAATVGYPEARFDGRLDGPSWSVNAPIPEPRGAAQGSIVASNDGSVIYSIGGGCCNAQYPDGFNKVLGYFPDDDFW